MKREIKEKRHILSARRLIAARASEGGRREGRKRAREEEREKEKEGFDLWTPALHPSD